MATAAGRTPVPLSHTTILLAATMLLFCVVCWCLVASPVSFLQLASAGSYSGASRERAACLLKTHNQCATPTVS